MLETALLDPTLNLSDQLDRTIELVTAHKRREDRIRWADPLVRIWDAEWGLHFVISGEYSASFQFISNDTGPGQIELPFDHPAAAWIHDSQGRIDRGEGRGVHITVDYCVGDTWDGLRSRWSGRMDSAVVETRDDGDEVMVLAFAHDYENLKFYQLWSAPWLKAMVQWPKAFFLAGPLDWVILTTLHLNLIREHNPLVTLPDDPLDLSSYITALDQSQWSVVVRHRTFAQSVQNGAIWGIIFARFSNAHDAFHTLLEDGEMSLQCTRYLEGDPTPWEGANLRHGTLVVDVVDKSGVLAGTANGGSAFDGIRRTISEFAEDFIDSTESLIMDVEAAPDNYYVPGNKHTDPGWPYVIYRTGYNSGIETSKFINSPSKAVQVVVGGHSMPGINETIGASIQAVGDILGGLLFMPSLGGSIDAMLKPLYEDVIFAWWAVKSQNRASNSGWSRYFEYMQSGANKAFTISALMVLRAGFWATKTTIANEIQVLDAAPYMCGGDGIGHYFLDDRIGFYLENDPTHLLWIDRARKIELAWDAETAPGWTPTIGDPRNLQDPAQRALGKIEYLIAGLTDLGVW